MKNILKAKMKTISRIFLAGLFSALLLAGLFSCMGTDKFTVCSPDGKLAIRITLDGQGCLFYGIIRNDSLLLYYLMP